MPSRSWWKAMVLSSCIAASAVAAADTQWTPEQWKDEDTLKLCTSTAEDGEYCFPVWLVVIDGQVYVRLGSRAADRVKSNTTAPFLPVEVGEARFEKVRLTEAPEYVDRVAEAMADKYWSDLLIGLFPHPLTLRLEMPEAP